MPEPTLSPRERIAKLLYAAAVAPQPNPPSWEYRALYSPDGHAPYYRMADALLVDRANTGPAIGPPTANVPEHTDYVANRAAETSGQQTGPVGSWLAQKEEIAALRAQLATAQARVEALLFAENRALWAKQDAARKRTTEGSVAARTVRLCDEVIACTSEDQIVRREIEQLREDALALLPEGER